MLGFFDLSGSDPCPRCGSESGDCDWVRDEGRCGEGCTVCGGANAGRCTYCDEVVPCGMSAARSPREDALCAWRDLAKAHGLDCRWVRSRGGEADRLPASIRAL